MERERERRNMTSHPINWINLHNQGKHPMWQGCVMKWIALSLVSAVLTNTHKVFLVTWHAYVIKLLRMIVCSTTNACCYRAACCKFSPPLESRETAGRDTCSGISWSKKGARLNTSLVRVTDATHITLSLWLSHRDAFEECNERP